ncbi:LCP family protein [Bacillus sp. FJAT-49736]|uniref:LCP family protein n=1 Tax=Bacillus sp. FJAT-49736 TaxID=2833582 RepID=UPI001BC9721A|nr:LCP family protein [Bacillus sp. FJAT-49736]MBS4172896.1 LCP family protein [Bacillus sp. FJAT-49736]
MESRIRHKRKKRIRKGRVFILVFFLFIFAISGWILFQYYDGVRQSSKEIKNSPDEKIIFNGKKDSNGKTNILLLGVDRRKNENSSNSDTMIIAQYDPEKNSIKLVSLMRDMYVHIPGYNGMKKMNSSFLLGGPELTRKTIQENFGVDIQYFVMIDFKGFENVIDTLAPEGIEVNVEHAMSENIGVSLKPGLQNLNGKELLGYARFRHDDQNDWGRVKRQQDVIKIVSNKVLSANGILKAPKLLGTIQPFIKTNISNLEELNFMKIFLLHRPNITKTLTIPIKNSYTIERVPVFGDVLRIDEAANRNTINAFLSDTSEDAVVGN